MLRRGFLGRALGLLGAAVVAPAAALAKTEEPVIKAIDGAAPPVAGDVTMTGWVKPEVMKFGDPKFIGQHTVLEDETFYVKREAFNAEFFTYEKEPVGPTAPEGPPGVSGEQGVYGQQGDPGPDYGYYYGPQGNPRVYGPPGPDYGPTGPIGPTGPVGSIGATGPTGYRGVFTFANDVNCEIKWDPNIAVDEKQRQAQAKFLADEFIKLPTTRLCDVIKSLSEFDQPMYELTMASLLQPIVWEKAQPNRNGDAYTQPVQHVYDIGEPKRVVLMSGRQTGKSTASVKANRVVMAARMREQAAAADLRRHADAIASQPYYRQHHKR